MVTAENTDLIRAFAEAPLRLRRPAHYAFPPKWQTRVEQIDRFLSAGGDFADEFRALRQVERDWEWPKSLREIVERWPDLLPGEAGHRVAIAIAYDSPPTRFRCDADTEWMLVDVFTDPVPRYCAQFTRGGRNVFASRRARNERPARILQLLAGGIRQRPLTHREAAGKMGMTGDSFQRELTRLRKKCGVSIRSSNDQKRVVSIFTGRRNAFRKTTAPGRRSPKIQYVDVPVGFASLCTGLGAAELVSLGAQRMRTNKNEFHEMLDVVRVPAELLIREPPHPPLEVLRFLDTLERPGRRQ